MRISDSILGNAFIKDLNSVKSRVAELQVQIATGKKLQKPSDSPSGTSKVIKLQNYLNSSDLYSKNIGNAIPFIDETVSALDSINDEVNKVLTSLTELKNPANQSDLTVYANQIDMSLNAIMDKANSKYDGKYLFGGTDFSSEPFGLSADKQAVIVKPGDISGDQNIKISPSILQKINLSGTEVFGTIVKQGGNFDTAAAAGSVFTNQTSVYDAKGNEYTLTVNYTKTAANSYDLTYDITDSAGSSIFPTAPPAQQLQFNSSTGSLESVNGDTSSAIRITEPNLKIDFSLDLSSLKENNNSSSISLSANQDNDIFNTLMNIKENLKAGIIPDDAQIDQLKNFSNHILNNASKAGNIINQLNDTEDLLNSKKLAAEDLIGGEENVDVAQAIVDLQQQDYLLQVSYKLSAMILPKSILDFL
ncbi:MAG TPA: flagellar hook-associated protein FlgL [Ignavibacteriaceae bacterium]|nr:flagellar hook-associated protein FlgL [Ignavibacteriaceae bacterium]